MIITDGQFSSICKYQIPNTKMYSLESVSSCIVSLLKWLASSSGTKHFHTRLSTRNSSRKKKKSTCLLCCLTICSLIDLVGIFKCHRLNIVAFVCCCQTSVIVTSNTIMIYSKIFYFLEHFFFHAFWRQNIRTLKIYNIFRIKNEIWTHFNWCESEAFSTHWFVDIWAWRNLLHMTNEIKYCINAS